MKPREWWIGITESGFDKWLTRKSPEEIECRNVFISSDTAEGCAEYVPVIEKSAYDELKNKYDEIISYLPKIPTQPYEKELALKLKIATEALEFYAAGENIYHNQSGLTEGKYGGTLGTTAREALKQIKGEG